MPAPHTLAALDQEAPEASVLLDVFLHQNQRSVDGFRLRKTQIVCYGMVWCWHLRSPGCAYGRDCRPRLCKCVAWVEGAWRDYLPWYTKWVEDSYAGMYAKRYAVRTVG